MTLDLWSANRPSRFWRCLPSVPEGTWEIQSSLALATVDPSLRTNGSLDATSSILSESIFGDDHWQLSRTRKLYYLLKPLFARRFIRILRRAHTRLLQKEPRLSWPIEDRFCRFLWESMRRVVLATGGKDTTFINFWPNGKQYALVLTHDVETAAGQSFVRQVAELERRACFRSSFNFVPERYDPDLRLMQELRESGFEVGVHGLKHDGRLFASLGEFRRRAKAINRYIQEFDASGFRSPLTHRNPYWMQELQMEYDSSFFDTDPFEPIPGGTMSIWPFHIGHFIELPYTLAQDQTLVNILQEKTPLIWLSKVDFIKRYRGMVLMITHPDYLREPDTFYVYESFLAEMAKRRDELWHALPRDIARWWRARSVATSVNDLPRATVGAIRLENDRLVVD